MQDRLTDLEEKLAHLTRLAEDLSAIVARQEDDIDALTRRVGMLMQREAGRENDEGGTVSMVDERPPHY